MNMLLGLGIPVLIFVFSLIIMGLIIAKLYKRTTPEKTMIRTGAGGIRVIQNGGALVIPMMHEITWVNMRTLGLEIIRSGTDALITADRMRVDVGTKFYVRVKPDEEGIAQASKTLGDSTFNPEALRKLIEDKLVDALRSVGATMTMDQMHENRAQFVQKVQDAVDKDLVQNGLELESVSLTQLDQTPFNKLDENNAFNAVGMQKLAQVVADSKKARAQIASEARVRVATTEQEAELKELSIKQTTAEATITQEMALATARANSGAAIAVAQSKATSEQQTARIQQEQSLAISEQDRQIAINEKSMAESEARAKADLARAEAVRAAESVNTAGQVAVADRAKQIAIIEAERDAERSATGTRVAAATRRAAAEDEAAAIMTKARADADAVLITAQAAADARKAEAEGIKAVALAQAEGRTAQVAADNSMSNSSVSMAIQMERLRVLPDVVTAMVKPAEHIGSITLQHVTGLGGGTDTIAAPAGGAAGSVTDAIMGMALNLPMLKSLGEQAGINIGNGLTGVLSSVGDASSDVNQAASITNDGRVVKSR